MMKKIIALCLIVAIAYGATTDCALTTTGKGNVVIGTAPLISKYITQCTAIATCFHSGIATKAGNTATDRNTCVTDPCSSVTTTANAVQAACLAVTSIPCVYNSAASDADLANAKCVVAACANNCQMCQTAGTAADGATGQGATCTALTALNCVYTVASETVGGTWPCLSVCAGTTAGCAGCTTATNQFAAGMVATDAYNTAAALMKTACTLAGAGDLCAYTPKTATAKALCVIGACTTAGAIACKSCTSMADCQLATKGGSNEDCVWDTAATAACKIGECGISTSTKFACGLCSAADCVLATKGAFKGRNCAWQAAVTTGKFAATCVRGDCLASSLKFACGICTATECVAATQGGLASRGCVLVPLAGTVAAHCYKPAPVTAAAAAASGFVKGLPVLSMIILAICLLAEF